MAQMLPAPPGKTKQRQPTIDLTAMVDLGFLLISFFIFTTTLARPNALTLLMPKPDIPTPAKASTAITALLAGEGRVIVYEGLFDEASAGRGFVHTTLSVSGGLGNLLRNKQKTLGANRSKLLYIIKPTMVSSYKDVVAALDEAAINNIARFVVAEPDAAERLIAEQ